MSGYGRALARIAVGALVLRLALLLARGDYVMYDEGYYLLLARSLARGDGYVLAGLPHVALSPLQPLLVALLSLTGISELWASRLLAAVAGALLVVPVAAIVRRIGGPRAALVAALLVAAAPGLMTFVPFFPGEGWNLYFGSEPLYLLLAVGTLAGAMRALETDRAAWWAASGALAAGAFLTRGEGIVLGPMLLLLLALRRPAAWRGLALAAGVGVLCAAPYLVYLRLELGRWALSGRVQAAAAVEPRTTGEKGEAASPARRASPAEALVWRGDHEAYYRAAYRLDRTGTRMSSQYWGVSRAPSAPAPVVQLAMRDGAAPGARTSAASPPPAASDAARRLGYLGRGLAAVAPVWLLLLGAVGLLAHRRRTDVLFWTAPLLAAALLPAILVYVEPRGLLPVVPVAALGAALAASALLAGLRGGRRRRARRVLPLAAAGAAVLLVAPTLRELLRAAPGERPLQRVAAARRAVGAYLGATLPADAIVVSWHPAVAYFAQRDWRVLPYESIDRLLGYARAQGASAVVLSRFEPSPLASGPQPFHVLLLDRTAPRTSVSPEIVRLERVAEMPLLLVSRVVPERPR